MVLRLRVANLQLIPKKSNNLFQKQIKYLVHLVSESGMAVDPDVVCAVQEWPQTKDKHELRNFLGLCTYYRRCACKFPNIANLLTRM